ncbi:MAG: IS200/IS605 family transposase [Ignavibacteria bacterium]|nr:IS200/IS605 family transposase [Ignavibacteria bacterium]
MPFIKIWIHLIFSTKNRAHLITKELKRILLAHIRENAKSKDIYLDSVNCVSDHIHLLVSLKGEQSISKVTMLLKGESSYWINQNNLSKLKFEWQDEYIAVSIGESSLTKVRKYIADQEEHHKKKTFAEEYEELIKEYGFEKLRG